MGNKFFWSNDSGTVNWASIESSSGWLFYHFYLRDFGWSLEGLEFLEFSLWTLLSSVQYIFPTSTLEIADLKYIPCQLNMSGNSIY